MSIKATLITPSDDQIAIISAALFSGLCRFPQLFVVVESETPLAHGCYRFVLDEDTSTSVGTPVHESPWHTLAVHQSGASRHLLWLSTAHDCLQEVPAFGANDLGPSQLVGDRLGGGTAFDIYTNYEPCKIEALISQNETVEQLARRVACYANDVFVLRPPKLKATNWAMHWAPGASALARTAVPKIAPSAVTQISSSTHRFEQQLQQLSVPTKFAPSLIADLRVTRVRQTQRPVQIGQTPDRARQEAQATNELGRALETLQTRWVEITRDTELQALWGAGVIDADDQGDEDDVARSLVALSGASSVEDGPARKKRKTESGSGFNDQYFVVSSLFVYTNDAVGGHVSRARSILEEALGCATQGAKSTEGWMACALTVPLSEVPHDKKVLESMIVQAAPESIWARMIASVGCSYPDLSAHLAPPLGPVMAIVVNEPTGFSSSSSSSSSSDPIARNPDKSQYRTKIWVRPLGSGSDVLVDWATPFASEGGHGDLVLVPTANTLGFLLFQHGHGAPLFFATTHYRDVPVSKEIDPKVYKHGLVTDGGLVMHEVTKNSMVRAHVELRTKAANFKEIVGG